jgi:hypothetical protein
VLVVEEVPLEGVARDATTLLDVLQAFADVGFDGSFQAAPGARVRCLRCNVETVAGELDVLAMRRLEGASDPADMLATVAFTCPACGTRGVLVANFGPEAMDDDVEVLRALQPPPPPAKGIAV